MFLLAVFAVWHEPEVGSLGHDGAEASLPAKVRALETRDITCIIFLIPIPFIIEMPGYKAVPC